MNAMLRMLVGLALVAGACYGWLEVNRIWFAFDPLSRSAWQAAADALSGVQHFDAFSMASWRRAAELAARPGAERFASIWVIDTGREAAWLALNLLAVTVGPVWIALRAAEIASDTGAAARQLASALARLAPRRAAGGAPAVARQAAPAANPRQAAPAANPRHAAPAAKPSVPAEQPAAPGAAAATPFASDTATAPPPAAPPPAAVPSAAVPRAGTPPARPAARQPAEPEAAARDVDVARAELESTTADFAFLRPVAASTSEDLLLRQLAEAAARSNVVEAWPGITLVAAASPTPTNRVFAAGDATVVVLIADRPGPDLEAWAAAMSDWLADQLTEVAGDELFCDSFDPLKPAAVLAVRDPGHWPGGAGMSVDAGAATIAISRLEEYFIDFGRRHGPLHPQLRDLLDDAFGYQ